MLKFTWIPLISVLVAGCGTTSNRFGPDMLPDSAPSQSSGVVLLSTSAKEKCVSAATFLKVLRDRQQYSSSELGLLSVDAYVLPSDFNDVQGNVHALALSPGRYYLAPWLANPYYKPKRVPRFDFEVRPGEVTYLGNLHMSVQCASSTVSSFSDQWQRDGAIVHLKKPSLDISTVRKQILRPSGLAVGEN